VLRPLYMCPRAGWCLTPCGITWKISSNVRQRRRRPTLEALRRARVDAGLTISELAKRAGVSRDTISHAEKGRHSLQGPTLSKIAYALGRAPSELLADEERLAPKAPRRSSAEPSLFNGLEAERRDYGSGVWIRINELVHAAEQWQLFLDEGLYDREKLALETLKSIDAVSLDLVLRHGREAAAMKRESTDEERERLEQAERRLIDNNLEFWGRVEDELADEKVTYLAAVRGQRQEWKQAARNSRTA
jgi:transcriptional regulator with XRE-family HTH domain